MANINLLVHRVVDDVGRRIAEGELGNGMGARENRDRGREGCCGWAMAIGDIDITGAGVHCNKQWVIAEAGHGGDNRRATEHMHYIRHIVCYIDVTIERIDDQVGGFGMVGARVRQSNHVHQLGPLEHNDKAGPRDHVDQPVGMDDAVGGAYIRIARLHHAEQMGQGVGRFGGADRTAAQAGRQDEQEQQRAANQKR